MKYSEARQGRVFVIRLEDGEVLDKTIESFAKKVGVSRGMLIAVGAADKCSKLVVGPDDGRANPVVPMEHLLENVHEVTGVGTLFPNAEGKPVLHMHVACGRKDWTVSGCVRRGVKVWHVMEVVLVEFLDCTSIRAVDPDTGFELLNP
jgi:predicted DNA-binding protein with PD1-like motif